MPALLCGSWRASTCFRTRIGTMNWFVLVLVVLLVLENVQTGWVVEDEDEAEDEWPSSWKARGRGVSLKRLRSLAASVYMDFPSPGTLVAGRGRRPCAETALHVFPSLLRT